MTNPEITMCKLLGKHKLKKVSRFKLICDHCGCEFVDEEEIRILMSEIDQLRKENDRLKDRVAEVQGAKKIIDSFPKQELERWKAKQCEPEELDKLSKTLRVQKRPQYYEDYWY